MVTKTKRDVRGVEFVWGGAINVLCSETENQLTSAASESLCGQFQQHNIAKGNQVTYDIIVCFRIRLCVERLLWNRDGKDIWVYVHPDRWINKTPKMRCKYLLIPKQWTAPNCQTATCETKVLCTVLSSTSLYMNNTLSLCKRLPLLTSATTSLKADSHIAYRAHAVPLPCRAVKGSECVFPIWFTHCGRVWFTPALPCHAMLRQCRYSQGHGTARPSLDGRAVLCKSNGKDTF